MRRVARLLILWLMAMALPIQGIAAATMLHCGAGANHGVQGHEVHAHHHAAADGAAQPDHSPHHPHDDGKPGCSACASCCSAAALPAISIMLASQEPASSVLAVPHLPTAAFLTSGPERPPRTMRS